MSSSPAPAPQPKKKPNFKKPNFKKPNFKKPAAAKPAAAAADKGAGTTDEFDFFNRSKEYYLVAASQNNGKEPGKKHARDNETKPVLAVDGDSDYEPASRKRRSIDVGDDSDYGGGGERNSEETDILGRVKRRANVAREKFLEREKSLSLTPRPSRTPTASSVSPVPAPVRLTRAASSRQTAQALSQAIELSDDDDELDLPISPSVPRRVASLSFDNQFFAAIEARTPQKEQEERAPLRPEEKPYEPTSSSLYIGPPDATVHILVTSPIDNTDPIIVKRKLNQKLRDVRIAWCSKQNFTPSQMADVILVFRGKRVFDFTLCRAIGFEVNSSGSLIPGEGIYLPEDVDDEPKVHLEAVTKDILEQRGRERDAASMAPEDGAEEEEEEDKEEEVIRLTLRAKGLKEFKIKVKPDTKVEKLISAFRKANSIEDDKHVRLDFEGDTLDPNDTIADTDLEDMLPVDVYIR